MNVIPLTKAVLFPLPIPAQNSPPCATTHAFSKTMFSHFVPTQLTPIPGEWFPALALILQFLNDMPVHTL